VDVLSCQGAQNIGLSNHKFTSALKCTVLLQCNVRPSQTDGRTLWRDDSF